MTLDVDIVARWLFSALVAAIIWIFNSVRSEIKKDRELRERMYEKFEVKVDRLESAMTAVAETLNSRVSTVERSVDSLWGEHRVLKDVHCSPRAHRDMS